MTEMALWGTIILLPSNIATLVLPVFEMEILWARDLLVCSGRVIIREFGEVFFLENSGDQLFVIFMLQFFDCTHRP